MTTGDVEPRGGVQAHVVGSFVDLAADALAEAREEVDALNVYPVPDGDTGTNMYLTVIAARDALRQARHELRYRGVAESHPEHLDALLEALARGALLGARGNSGVIVSEMLRAVCRRLARATAQERNAQVLAESLDHASRAADAAVGTPVEGTILTVARAAAAAGLEAAAAPDARGGDVFTAAAAAARAALARTPEQLEALRLAGVVDAGGRGFCVILDAAETALTGRRPVPQPARLGRHTIPVPHRPPGDAGDLVPGGPAYEVMYLLDAPAERIGPLKAALGALGDSLVVVGDESLWNVHVHVDDVGAALEAGIEAGRPHRIRVTHFADQVAAGPAAADAAPGEAPAERPERPERPERAERPASVPAAVGRVVGRAVSSVSGLVARGGAHAPTGPLPAPAVASAAPAASGAPAETALSVAREGRRVVAVAAGPGLRAVFEEAGAVVVESGPGRRPSTGEVLAAIRACGTREVVVLPNDPDSVRVAQLAAGTATHDLGLTVAVIPTRAQVQGLAALAVHEPGRAFDRDVLEMTATSRQVRHGGVTRAARTAMTMAGPCEAGDALGIVAGDFAVVGAEVDEVAREVLRRLLGGGGELVTLVSGGGADDAALAEGCAAWLEREFPVVDVVVYAGGQERYPLLVSVE